VTLNDVGNPHRPPHCAPAHVVAGGRRVDARRCTHGVVAARKPAARLTAISPLATSTVRLNAIKDTLAITFRQLAALPLSLAHRTLRHELFSTASSPPTRVDADRQEINQTLEPHRLRLRAAAGDAARSRRQPRRHHRLMAQRAAERLDQPGQPRVLRRSVGQGHVDAVFARGAQHALPGLYFANRVERNGAVVGVAVVKQDAEDAEPPA